MAEDKLDVLVYAAYGILGGVIGLLIIFFVIILVQIKSLKRKISDLKSYTESYVSGNNFKLPRLDNAKDISQPAFKSPTQNDVPPITNAPPINEPPQGYNRQSSMNRNPMGGRGDMPPPPGPSWQQPELPRTPTTPPQNFSFGRPMNTNYERSNSGPGYNRELSYESRPGGYDRPLGMPRGGGPPPQMHTRY